MKVRSYGALMGALLTISSVDVAEAATCPCAPATPPPPTHAAPAPKPKTLVAHPAEGNSLAYAQSYYDYQSAGRVTEAFVRNAPVAVQPATLTAPMAQDEGWRVAPNDAHIQFYSNERKAITPYVTNSPTYYLAPANLNFAPVSVIDHIDMQGFNGGVGYSGGGNGGGGGGGNGSPVSIIQNSGGGSDEPPNGGGENLPGGYGPTYQGVWQGPVIPTRGGL